MPVQVAGAFDYCGKVARQGGNVILIFVPVHVEGTGRLAGPVGSSGSACRLHCPFIRQVLTSFRTGDIVYEATKASSDERH